MISDWIVRACLRQGAWLEQTGRAGAAIAVLSGAARRQGVSPELRCRLHQRLADLLLRQDRGAEALPHLGIVAELEADAVRGKVVANLARDVAPESPDGRWELGKALFESGNRVQAIPHLEAVVQAQPGQMAALKMLAKAYTAAGDHAGEAQTRIAMFRLRPDEVANRQRLAKVLFKLGRPDEAALFLCDPKDGPRLATQMGIRPTISICIPYYKGAATITRCVSSIFGQNIVQSGGAEVEVVITVDDDSEETRKVLASLEQVYPVAIHYNPRQLGLTGNWQAALSRAHGEVVTLLHQDDWYAPGCLDAVVRRFTTEPTLVLLGFNALLNGEADRVQLASGDVRYTTDDLIARPENYDIVFAPSTAFIRRSALEGLKTFYEPEYKWSPERELYFRVAENCPGMSVSFDRTPLICRGLSDDQFSVNNEDLRVLDLLVFWERVGRRHPEQASKLGAYILDQTLGRMERWEKAKVIHVSSLLNSWAWFERVYADPRFAALVAEHPERFRKFLQRHAVKHGPNIGAMGYEAPRRALTIEPAASAARTAVESAMAGGEAKLDVVRRRADRVLESSSFESPLIICGFHHSGTRLLAQVLEEVGVFQHVNSRTHEWSYIQELNTVMLPGWMDPDAIEAFDASVAPKVIDKSSLAFRLASDCYAGGGPWGQKDPRNSVTVDAWLDAFPKARIVNIVRDPMDVLGTLPKDYAPFSPNGETPQEAADYWARTWLGYLARTRRAMNKATYAVEVSFEDLCAQPVVVARQMVAALDLDCNVRPNNFDRLNIMPSKVGVYRDWIVDGRLLESHAEVLRTTTAGTEMQWARPTAAQRVGLEPA